MPDKINIRTAVIPVAGYGTRRLPITKSIEKCMLPIGNRPVVDYVVEDCAKAGIERIIFITSEESRQLADYYGENLNLEQYLEDKGSAEDLELVRGLNRELEFEYIVQPNNGAYGTAVPVYLAENVLSEDEYFAVRVGDAFPFSPSSDSILKDAIDRFDHESYEHMLLGLKIEKEKAPLYGLFDINDEGLLRGFLEKPSIDRVPETPLININNIIFNTSIFKFLNEYMNNPPPEVNRGEYYLTDMFMTAVDQGEIIKVLEIEAEMIDAGNLTAWLSANNRFAELGILK